MPIVSTIRGDLIDLAKQRHFKIICHGCNCFNTMGAGIALQIATEFPEAAAVDLATISGDKDKLGTYTSAYIGKYKMRVFNLYTQYAMGGRFKYPPSPDVSYKAIRQCFETLNDWLYDFEEPIGIPMIGAGLAGGDWFAIREIIDLSTPSIEIVVVEYCK